MVNKKYGIDVSEYQGKIDWNSARSDIRFAILRSGFGITANQVDKRFFENAKNAYEYGIPLGAYWFLYALNVEDAAKNAKAFIEIVKYSGVKFEYPLYLDIEGDTTRYMLSEKVNPSPELISDMIRVFCEIVEQNGYYAGIYSDYSFIKAWIKPDLLDRYDLWLAYWVPNFNPDSVPIKCNMWQWTNSGTVHGIDGYVDLNYTALDFPKIMRDNDLNNLSDKSDTLKNKLITSGTVNESDELITIVLNKSKK